MRIFRNRRKFTEEEYFELTGFTMREACSILNLIGDELAPLTSRSRALTPHQQLFLALRILKTGDNYKSAGLSLGVSASSAGRALLKVCRIILQKMSHYVTLNGSEMEWRKLSEFFWQKFGLPNVVGAFDGTIIKVFNKGDRNLFWSRKLKASINCQVLMDSERKIRFISVKAPGSWHDRKCYAKSRLAEIVETGWRPFADACALADCGYQGVKEFLIPIPRRYTTEQAAYYRKIAIARRFIENGFADWKHSFRILQRGVNCKSMKNNAMVIQATSILYNFKLEHRYKTPLPITVSQFPRLRPRDRNLPTFASQQFHLFNYLRHLQNNRTD